MFFNTTAETGATLQRYQDRADSQEDQVLSFFHRHPGPWTSEQIREMVFGGSVPITSGTVLGTQ